MKRWACNNYHLHATRRSAMECGLACGCNALSGRCFRHGWPLLVLILACMSFPFVAFSVMVWLHS